MRVNWILFLGIFFSLGTSYALPAFDGDFACTSSQKADQYVRDFKVDTQSFGGRELCKGNVDFKKLMNDLEIIESGSFDSSGSNNLIRGFINPSDYYSWMRGETRGMNRGNDVPYATAYNSWGYFTMQDGWAKLSTLGRVGTVIHEARHTAGYRHVSCTQGPYAGAQLPGCDTTYEYGGSHAIEMEYYAHVVVQGNNFHPLYKKMARLMALGRSNFVFNKQVIKPREGILLTSTDNQEASLIDGEKAINREIRGTGVLKRTSFGASLFENTQAWAFDLYNNWNEKESVKDDYSYFKLLMGAKGAPANGRFKDFEEIDLNNRRYVLAIDEQNRAATYDFPNGGWTSFQPLGINPAFIRTRLPGSQAGLYIIDTTGVIHKFDPTNRQLATNLGRWDATQITVIKAADGSDLILTTQGELVNPTTRAIVLQGNYNQAVNVPLYDAFEVNITN